MQVPCTAASVGNGSRSMRWPRSMNEPINGRKAYLAGGIAGADAMLVDAAVSLFDTEDAHGAIDTFLTKGPGQAVFTGR
jgi:hypothetical protein